MRNLFLCKDVVSDADKMNVFPQFPGSYLVSQSVSVYTTWISSTVVADCGGCRSPMGRGSLSPHTSWGRCSIYYLMTCKIVHIA